MNGSEAAPSPTCRGLFGPERVGEGEISGTFATSLSRTWLYYNESARDG